MPSRLTDFLAELKRRRVYTVGATYVVVGLGVLGAAEVILEPLGLDRIRPAIVILTILGFPLALVLAWAYEVTPEGVVRDTGAVVASTQASPDAPAPGPTGPTEAARAPVDSKSIAVLPFADMSPDGDQEYFGDGIAEELLNALTKLSGLRVAARTSAFSFKGRDVAVQEIGRVLSVGTVLEGSIRKSGEQVRVTAQLIDATTGYHLWSETYQRELRDVFAIQDEIARSVVEALQVELFGETTDLVDESTKSLEAYELYLKGRHFWGLRTADGLESAVGAFERAIEADPTFADAFSGLSDTYNVWELYHPTEPSMFRTLAEKSLSAAREAVRLAPRSGMARTSLARAHMKSGDWDAAAGEFATALELSPGYATARHWYGIYLWYTGQVEPAIPELREATRLDPASQAISSVLAWTLYCAERFDEAAAEAQRCVELDPTWPAAWLPVAVIALGAGRYERAAEAFRRRVEISGQGSFDPVAFGRAADAIARYRGTGEPGEAAVALPLLMGDQPVGIFIAALMGVREMVLTAFVGVVRAGGYETAAALHVVVAGELLRDDPRYQSLLREANISW